LLMNCTFLAHALGPAHRPSLSPQPARPHSLKPTVNFLPARAVAFQFRVETRAGCGPSSPCRVLALRAWYPTRSLAAPCRSSPRTLIVPRSGWRMRNDHAQGRRLARAIWPNEPRHHCLRVRAGRDPRQPTCWPKVLVTLSISTACISRREVSGRRRTRGN